MRTPFIFHECFVRWPCYHFGTHFRHSSVGLGSTRYPLHLKMIRAKRIGPAVFGRGGHVSDSVFLVSSGLGRKEIALQHYNGNGNRWKRFHEC